MQIFASLNTRKEIRIWFMLILLPGLFLSCSQQQGGPGGGFSMPPTPVETATVVQATVTEPFEAVGTIEAIDAITVVSEIDAIVIDLPFDEGQKISKGGLIAQLDDVQLQAELARAEAVREQRKVSHERIKSIVEQGMGVQQNLDDAAAALKVAEAELALAKARLQKTRIVAPFAGILSARRVSSGAFVRAGTAITDLVKIDELRVTFSAPERFYSSLRRGSEVAISTTAYPDDELPGRVEVIEPVVDESTRRAKIIAHVANLGGKIRPGMSANVTVVLSERENALVVPDEAVFVEGEQSLVFVVKPDSMVARTPVSLGTRQRGTVEVVKGVDSGTLVVRAGHQKLFEGAKVIPTSHATNSEPSNGGAQ